MPGSQGRLAPFHTFSSLAPAPLGAASWGQRSPLGVRKLSSPNDAHRVAGRALLHTQHVRDKYRVQAPDPKQWAILGL